jgi:hypothetical protein
MISFTRRRATHISSWSSAAPETEYRWLSYPSRRSTASPRPAIYLECAHDRHVPHLIETIQADHPGSAGRRRLEDRVPKASAWHGLAEISLVAERDPAGDVQKRVGVVRRECEDLQDRATDSTVHVDNVRAVRHDLDLAVKDAGVSAHPFDGPTGDLHDLAGHARPQAGPDEVACLAVLVCRAPPAGDRHVAQLAAGEGSRPRQVRVQRLCVRSSCAQLLLEHLRQLRGVRNATRAAVRPDCGLTTAGYRAPGGRLPCRSRRPQRPGRPNAIDQPDEPAMTRGPPRQAAARIEYHDERPPTVVADGVHTHGMSCRESQCTSPTNYKRCSVHAAAEHDGDAR